MAGKPATPPVGHDARTCVCAACCDYRLAGRGKGTLGKLFSRKPKPKEYRRTCQQCGAVRYLSVADATAKAPSTAAAKLDYLGSSLQNMGSADARSTLRL